jgi:3-hydroxymyristoyl/3-hydroxydecanoyl-(acyl carrier protein) dehydratase
MQRLIAITEIPDSLTVQENCQVLCYYKNTGKQLQLARISNMDNGYFERIVFPGEQLLFEALPEAELEIHTSTIVGAIFVDKILCSCLQVQDSP